LLRRRRDARGLLLSQLHLPQDPREASLRRHQDRRSSVLTEGESFCCSSPLSICYLWPFYPCLLQKVNPSPELVNLLPRVRKKTLFLDCSSSTPPRHAHVTPFPPRLTPLQIDRIIKRGSRPGFVFLRSSPKSETAKRSSPCSTRPRSSSFSPPPLVFSLPGYFESPSPSSGRASGTFESSERWSKKSSQRPDSYFNFQLTFEV
jgi:hypothetical protein